MAVKKLPGHDHRGWQILRDIREPDLQCRVFRFTEDVGNGDVNVWIAPLGLRQATFFFNLGKRGCFGGLGCTLHDMEDYLARQEAEELTDETEIRLYLQALSNHIEEQLSLSKRSEAHADAINDLIRAYPPKKELS